eukprot:12882457-Prorocentrum_lima.AAC.1
MAPNPRCVAGGGGGGWVLSGGRCEVAAVGMEVVVLAVVGESVGSVAGVAVSDSVVVLMGLSHWVWCRGPRELPVFVEVVVVGSAHYCERGLVVQVPAS